MATCFSCNAQIDFAQAQEPCLCDACLADIKAGRIPESYFADDAPIGWDEIEGGEEELTLDP